MPGLDPRLIQVGIDVAPAAIDLVKALFFARHPDAPQPSSAEVIALYESGYLTSLAKDAAWLAAHPEDPT